MTERDEREIGTRGFFLDAIVTAALLAIGMFFLIRTQTQGGQSINLGDIFNLIAMVVLAVIVGIILLPAHIPNGH